MILFSSLHLFESLCSLEVFTVFVIYVVMIWCKNGVWQNIYCHGTDLTISISLQHKQEKGCQLGFLLELLFEDAAALKVVVDLLLSFLFTYTRFEEAIGPFARPGSKSVQLCFYIALWRICGSCLAHWCQSQALHRPLYNNVLYRKLRLKLARKWRN